MYFISPKQYKFPCYNIYFNIVKLAIQNIIFMDLSIITSN